MDKISLDYFLAATDFSQAERRQRAEKRGRDAFQETATLSAMVQRALSEPTSDPRTESWYALVEHLHRFGRVTTAIHEHAVEQQIYSPEPALDRFRNEVKYALESLAESIRKGTPPTGATEVDYDDALLADLQKERLRERAADYSKLTATSVAVRAHTILALHLRAIAQVVSALADGIR